MPKATIFAVIFTAFVLYSFVLAGNIVTTGSPPPQYAWNDQIGWLNWGTPVGNVTVTSSTLSGYVTSQSDIVDLNCGDFNLCLSSNYKISRDSQGNLSGWAWNDNIGWISFNCSDPGICTSSNYKVYIDSQGYFHGWAWNDQIGWVSLNCADTSFGCTNSNYKVQTSFISYPSQGNLISNIFDTGYQNGVNFNTITWKGSLNNGNVQFQFAASNSPSGPWTFTGPGAIFGQNNCTSNTYYNVPSPNTPVRLNSICYQNLRYFRYEIYIYPSADNTQTPVVNSVIVNYSP